MTIQNALLFLAAVRRDAELRNAIGERQDETGALCSLGRDRGLAFDANDLQQAFRHDWALRALREGKVARAVNDPSGSDG
jgi:hypothetical protein